MKNPVFPYNDQVPRRNEKISITQKPILSNFQAINELINVNHVGFNDVVNFGKHTVTTFPLQGSAPISGADEMVLYAGPSVSVNGIELFYQYPSAGAVGQLTGNIGTGSLSSQGWSYLVAGILMKWGTLPVGTPAGVISYPTGGSIPAYTTSTYNIQFSTQGDTQVLYITNLTTTGFTLNLTSNLTQSVTWYAIGM